MRFAWRSILYSTPITTNIMLQSLSADAGTSRRDAPLLPRSGSDTDCGPFASRPCQARSFHPPVDGFYIQAEQCMPKGFRSPPIFSCYANRKRRECSHRPDAPPHLLLGRSIMLLFVLFFWPNAVCRRVAIMILHSCKFFLSPCLLRVISVRRWKMHAGAQSKGIGINHWVVVSWVALLAAMVVSTPSRVHHVRSCLDWLILGAHRHVRKSKVGNIVVLSVVTGSVI